jgi:hypothetical protein
MNSEDREALWMILERNSRAEIIRVLDDFRQVLLTAEENNEDPDKALYNYLRP